MKKFASTLLFSLAVSFCVAQKPVITTVTDRVQVSFPATPEVEESLGVKAYYLHADDYMLAVLLTDLSKNPNFKPESIDFNTFYSQVIKGIMAAAGIEKLLREEKIIIGKTEGREIQFMKDLNGIKDIRVTKRIILVDKALITVETWDFSGTQEALLRDFLNSIEIK